MSNAPGSFRQSVDRWAEFEHLASGLRGPVYAVVDERVAKLHPGVIRALNGAQVVKVRAGEQAKTLLSLQKVVARAAALPRSGTLIAIGGGTIGDLATVAAHLIKRGVRLIQVPTTLLAAVDSSVGGKGAVHAREAGKWIKNALGVFHYAEETWLCEELFTTLSARQRTEGAIEAWKMFATLDAGLVARFRGPPSDERELIREARMVKERICAVDPYELEGPRRLLNFGHTLGHVIESATNFKVRHGEAVGLGMLAALDLGRAVGVTADPIATEAERLFDSVGVGSRDALAQGLRGLTPPALRRLLAADKKVGPRGELNFVLLDAIGSARLAAVPLPVVERAFKDWRRGDRP